MKGFLNKKKKPLFARIIEKIKGDHAPYEQELYFNVISFKDIRKDNDELAVIMSRRDELKSEKHGNSDAVVTYKKYRGDTL